MTIWFLLAGGAAAVTVVIHCTLGGREIARPLLQASDIHAVAKYTNYYCWHLVSLTLAAMAGCFIWAGLKADAVELAVVATLLSAAFCGWSLMLVAWKKTAVFPYATVAFVPWGYSVGDTRFLGIGRAPQGTLLRLSHPDCTVGSGVSPDLLTPPDGSRARPGYPGHTAGREFHPVLRTSFACQRCHRGAPVTAR